MKKAIIFDLDGTLVDSIADLAEAVEGMLASRGHPGHSLAQYKVLVGNGFANLVFRALPETHRQAEYVESARAEASAYYSAHCLDKTRPYEGIVEVLQQLRGLGTDLAVLSNKPQALTAKVVEGCFGPGIFAIIRGEGPDFPRKPDPRSALDICEKLEVRPDEVLYLGDSDVDMKTAKAAGFTALGASWGFRSEKELREAGADALLKCPADLVQYL